jgi:hypothetical protein
MSRDDVLKPLELHHVSSALVEQQVQKRGIDFVLDADTESRMRKAGASETLISLVKKLSKANEKDSTPVQTEPPQAPVQPIAEPSARESRSSAHGTATPTQSDTTSRSSAPAPKVVFYATEYGADQNSGSSITIRGSGSGVIKLHWSVDQSVVKNNLHLRYLDDEGKILVDEPVNFKGERSIAEPRYMKYLLVDVNNDLSVILATVQVFLED